MALPRTQSSSQLRAVAAEEEKLIARMEKRLREAVASGTIDLSGGIKDLSEAAISTIARFARLYSHDAIVGGHRAGWKGGRASARLELGEPVDDVEPFDSTCPTCGKQVG